MDAPKRVLCIMDMAGVGRSSLAAVLPVLAACGVQACPMAPLVLSSHTGGFGAVPRQDITGLWQQALEQYHREKVGFDAIYTGYLVGEAQFALALQAARQYPDALLITDPVLGDNGKLYSGISAENTGWMRRLCEMADIITPNATESRLLLGLPPEPETDMPLAAKTLATGKRSVVITSSPTAQGIEILVKPAGSEPLRHLPVELVPQSYPGTGDLFTSALAGLVLQGIPLEQAAGRAGQFISQAARATYEGNGEGRMGIWFEPFLPLLRQP